MSVILDWVGQIQEDREAAGDSNDTGPRAEIVRKGCDWAASKGGFISGAPWIQATCRPYWDDDPGYPPPGAPFPPFEGGQCAGVNYRVFYQITEDGVPVNANNFVIPGPVGQFRRASDIPGDDRFQQGYTFQGGETIIINSADRELETLDIQRVDGQPDDCGNPEDIQPDPVGVPTLPPDGTPIDVSPPGWTGPPIEITFPPDQPNEPTYVEIDTTFGGGGNIFGPPTSGDPLPPGETGDPAEPLPPAEGDDAAEGEPTGDIEQPELENVIGYTWQFPAIPANRGGVAGKVPSTFFEAIGTIQLKLRSPDGLNYYSSQYVVRESRGAIVRDDPELDVVGVSWAFKPSFGVVQIRPLIAESE